jgi:hypothetical protein
LLRFIALTKHPDFDSALVYNPIDLNADAPIYAWDRGYETRQALLRAYPDRAVWFVKGPSITQKGFEIASGPIPARDLLKNEE